MVLLRPHLDNYIGEIIMNQQVKTENAIIKIAKHVVVEEIATKVAQIEGTPQFYKQKYISPIRWVCRKDLDKAVAKENKLFVVEIDRESGLTFSKYSDGSCRIPMKEVAEAKKILKKGLNIENLKEFNERLEIWIQEINMNIEEEEAKCKNFLEEEVVMEEIDDEDFDELEELEV